MVSVLPVVYVKHGLLMLSYSVLATATPMYHVALMLCKGAVVLADRARINPLVTLLGLVLLSIRIHTLLLAGFRF